MFQKTGVCRASATFEDAKPKSEIQGIPSHLTHGRFTGLQFRPNDCRAASTDEGAHSVESLQTIATFRQEHRATVSILMP